MNSYNNNIGKILQQSTIKIITKVEHPKWEKKYQNYGFLQSKTLLQ
jgi:hypothetical protein